MHILKIAFVTAMLAVDYLVCYGFNFDCYWTSLVSFVMGSITGISIMDVDY